MGEGRKTLSLSDKNKAIVEERLGLKTTKSGSIIIRLNRETSFVGTLQVSEIDVADTVVSELPEPTEEIYQKEFRPLPKRGDVLSCHFPLDETPTQPNPDPDKKRPVLVLATVDDIFQRTVGLPRPCVWVIYGTTQIDKERDGNKERASLIVPKREANLDRDTAFRFTRQAILSYDRENFKWGPETGTPILGTLSTHFLEKIDEYFPFFLATDGIQGSGRIFLIGRDVPLVGLDDFRLGRTDHAVPAQRPRGHRK